MLGKLFSGTNAKIVYRGYVDDARNTDNAWIETVALHFHCERELGDLLTLRGTNSSEDFAWLDINDESPRYAALNAAHKEWIKLLRS